MKILTLVAFLSALLIPRAFAADASIPFTPCASGCTNDGAVTGPGNSKLYPGVVLGDGTNPDTQKAAVNSSGQLAVSGASSAFVDGWNVTEGTKADSAWTSGSGSVIALLKAIATGAIGAVPAGTNTIGGTYPVATTAGGTGAFSEIVAANTTSVAVKASAGQIYGIRTFSNNTTPVYGKLYNATQGSTTCGSGTPQDRFLIPAQTGGSGFAVPMPLGEQFTTAITLCITGGIADSDSTTPAGTAYMVSIDYK